MLEQSGMVLLPDWQWRPHKEKIMKYLRWILLTLITTTFFFSPLFAAEKYCYVEGDTVVVGPEKLPTGWGNTSGFNLLSEARLKERGWLPYIDLPPGYNSDLQYLTFVNTVNENDVTKTYTINDYTALEMEQRIVTAKTEKVASLKYLARQKALVQYSKWVKDKSVAINELSTLEAIRNYALTTPDFDTLSTNILASITASGIADMTFSELDDWIDNNVTADASVKTALKKIGKVVLALLKLQIMGTE